METVFMRSSRRQLKCPKVQKGEGFVEVIASYMKLAYQNLEQGTLRK
jgi:hypothetical protein